MKVNVVVYRRNELEKSGILKIRIYDKKTTYISLDEKINLSDFSESKQRVKATHPKADQINRKIESKLSEILEKKNTFKKVEISEHLGFYEYSERFIKNQKTISSKKKYKTIVANFRAFLSSYTDCDNVKLIDITDVLVEDYSNFLFEETELKETTSYRYLKFLKTIINKAIEQNQVNYIRHPFSAIKFKNITTLKEYLNIDEVHRLNNLKYEDDTYLGITRNMTIFQIYCQGLRISDTLLLRYKDIQDDYLCITVRKTQKTMKIFINDILKDIIIKSIDFHDIKTKSNIEAVELNYGDDFDTYDDIHERYFELKSLIKKEEIVLNYKLEEERNFTIINTLKRNLNRDFIALINSAKKFIKDDFIFAGYLNKEHFIEYKPMDRLKEFQFNQLSSKVAMYNKRLKTIQKDAKIEKKLTSHIFRHTFANLALSQPNADIYSISKALAHSSVRETEVYLRNFNSKKVETLMYKISNTFTSFGGIEIPEDPSFN